MEAEVKSANLFLALAKDLKPGLLCISILPCKIAMQTQILQWAWISQQFETRVNCLYGVETIASKAAIEKARSLNRNKTLKKVEKRNDENDRVRFITTFDPRLPDLRRILKENHKIMVESDGQLKGAFPKPPMICYKGPLNLKYILCRAKLPPKRSRTVRSKKPGQRRCNKPSSRMCPFTALVCRLAK